MAEVFKARAIPTPVITYRSVGSGSGASDIQGPGPSYTASTSNFGCGDVPINKTSWDLMNESMNPVAQIPFLLGMVSFFHSIPGVGLVSTHTLLHLN